MSDDSRAPLNRLSAETRAKLRSTQILTSLPHIVSELLQNSIDSGAPHIDVGVDCEEWSCWVRDDGSGFAKDDLAQIAKGSEGGRYMSSKACPTASLESVSTFGFRGEALASMADLCCLEISSRTARARESWSIIMKGGQTLYAGPSVRWRRETAGTAVSVRDAFFNLPIRRLSHPSSSKTLEIIRQEIESYALVFPGISFSLEDTSKSNRGGGRSHSCILKIPKYRAYLSFIFCRSDINRHPVSYCDLHKLIDLRFSSSSFAKHVRIISGSCRRPPRKGEKKPIYVLNLTIPVRHIDNCMEPAKTAVQLGNKNMVARLLSSVIQSFLARHHFAPGNMDGNDGTPRKKRTLSRQAALTEPSISRSSTPDSYIRDRSEPPELSAVWNDPSTGETFIIDLRTGNSHPQSVPRGVSANGPIRIKSKGDAAWASLPTIHDMTMGQREVISAKDAVPDWLQEVLKVCRTKGGGYPGHPYPCNTQPSKRSNPNQHIQYFTPDFALSRVRFQREDLQTMRVISQVDRKFVACLIVLCEASIRHGAGKTLILVDQHAADERVRVERFLKEICSGFLSYHDKSGGVETMQLSPPIPVLLTHREASRLSQVPAYQKAFESWGVHFHGLQNIPNNEASMDSNDHAAYIQVFIAAIPEIVSEKLLSGNELQELVKGYLGTLENELDSLDIPAPPRSGACEIETRWVRALRWCPRVLLDLINSKACRAGAIMFNDSLTLEKCQRLIKQLSATAFPFQCAHGRPSLVPLTPLALQGDNPRSSPVDWQKVSAM
ncbi:hypothetical protein PISMIDRAFT_89800 [Pisolithus microcarpus 441]|uniref:MutL C-terminal dimerisation domain-containing protein n=1 Tax=Pisolithus microcarpus 441 TaxID=765257 RepID=A0A0C9ZT93_9AGAM|nr:hypothetical protein PISMIDRAFT_89800 [Pisolithus microcarpus 441]